MPYLVAELHRLDGPLQLPPIETGQRRLDIAGFKAWTHAVRQRAGILANKIGGRLGGAAGF